ncbi:MAG: TonB-dependent receptor [Candidatus Acidiferrales bacterium]
MNLKRLFVVAFMLAGLAFAAGVGMLVAPSALAQETTGGLQGTIKDPSGAVVPNAEVVLAGSSLVGTKTANTDDSGYYRFANVPPGDYVIAVTAPGFDTIKRPVTIEVGHLPTVDFALVVGKASTTVEVTSASPQIDVTTNVTTTNVTEDVIDNVPHGRSFQSVIQFAPSARNEPLMGNNAMGGYSGNGTGGSSPGSTANGSEFGFSVAGGSDSENSYLVEGQETANLIGGYSHTSVPFDFIQEVEIKNSGIQAEYGGALGGVVNVVMKKGSNGFHGSVFSYFENDAMDANQLPTEARYNPLSSQATESWGLLDPTFQEYAPKKDHTSDVFPGFTLSVPIWKDRIFGFVAFNPELNNDERSVNYDQPGGIGGGLVNFSQNTRTYYTNARVDFAVTQKLRVFASWLYQLQKQYGEDLPFPDSTNGLFNASSTVDPSAYPHNVGFTAPNSTTNIGADYTLTPRLVLTARFGYYFEDYHDFGLPTAGTLTAWETNGVNACEYVPGPTQPTDCSPTGTTPQFALPASLQQAGGFFNLANSQNFTGHNASKGIQVDTSLAWFKSGWLGTHNFKFGYQLNRLSNNIDQHYNVPLVQYFVGNSSSYVPFGPVGTANCAPFVAEYGSCAGQYGYINVEDYGSGGAATSYNHGLFAQDSWTLGKGVTVNLGLRVEREWLPAENQPEGGISHPINFGWGDKVAPRLGIAWDPTGRGKMKIFAGYGQFYDQMKLNLAISSFGGQYWSNCYYALNTSDVASIAPVFNSSNRYCFGTNSASEANFGGTTPTGITFLENQNYRANPTTCSTCTVTEEGVAPGLKPYKQHEATVGFDYQLASTLAFEARYDRRRLDHVIEDSALVNPAVGETFVIVNPGQGVNSTYDKFYNFLYGVDNSDCGSGCPPTIPAQRDYDGLEFRLTKVSTKHWSGMFSYTYSRLWGNYTGLTSSDEADGGGGRNSPNNSRSFDEPMFSWNDDGGSSSGLLPTDRPNTFKGYAYYELGWLHKFTTDFGIFQVVYQGSPETSYLDVGNAFPSGLTGGAFPVDVGNRGKWINVTQDPTSGLITVGNPYTKRTPGYFQTDFNLQQNYKIGETKVLGFSATISNLLNSRSVTSVEENMDSGFNYNYIAPGGLTTSAGTPFYEATFHPYDIATLMNLAPTNTILNGTGPGPLTVSSAYGQPNRYQIGRTIRLGVKFSF